MFIGEKYVQETFLGEESLNEKYIRVKKNWTQLQVKFQSSSKTLTVQLLCLWVALHAVGPGDRSYWDNWILDQVIASPLEIIYSNQKYQIH